MRQCPGSSQCPGLMDRSGSSRLTLSSEGAGEDRAVRDWAGGDAVLSRSQTTYYGALMVGARGARGEVHCRALCGRRRSALGGPP